MIYKKISLALFAVVAMVLIYCLPFYNRWVHSKFDGEVARISGQLQHLTPEDRMQARFGTTYSVESAITQMLNSAHAWNAVVLLPPKGFVNTMKMDATFEVPEPAVFYYFTGYKAVWKNSKDVDNANWALLLMQHKMRMKPLKNKEALDTLLAIYKPYN